MRLAADESGCLDGRCPSRHRCGRNEASGTRFNAPRQVISDFGRLPGEERCDDFWPKYPEREGTAGAVRP